MAEVCPQSTQGEQTSQNGLTPGQPTDPTADMPTSKPVTNALCPTLGSDTAGSQGRPQEPRGHSTGKKGMNLPLAYMSKDRVSKEDLGYTKQARDMQNQGSALLTHLQTMDHVCRQGKLPVWTGTENAAIFPSSLSGSSASKQNVNCVLTTNETLSLLARRRRS